MFKYIIRAEGHMALPVHSDLNWIEFERLIKLRCNKLHPKGHDVVFKWGVIEFINPVVMLAESYVDYLPALM